MDASTAAFPGPPLNLRRRFAIASLGIITVIALSLGWLLSNLLTQSLLQHEGEANRDFIQNLLTTDGSARYFAAPEDPELRKRFLGSMEHIAAVREPVRANAYRPDGTMLWSTDKALVGQRFPVNDELDEALSGKLVVHSGVIGQHDPKAEHQGLDQHATYFVESYIPLREPGSTQVLGVMELYKQPTQLSADIRLAVIKLWLACAICASGLFLTLYWIVARADRILRRQHAQLAEAQSLASAVELASAVAHNIRNPLASIRLSAELLEHSGTPQADLGEHCGDIVSAVERADRWISELVRVAQAPQLQPEVVALGPLVSACFDEMAGEMARRQVRGTVELTPPGHVLAHPAILRQILLSLMANAIEAMPEGGQLRVSWCEQGRLAGLHLTDSGHGIPDEVRKRLFRPFFSTKSGGLGIGLALVKRMVEQWQGSLSLSAAQPCGTCVEILLPRAEALRPASQVPQVPSKEGAPHGNPVGY
ncbi:sensor histidine kinase [Polaromonas jejuensis]|uniref:histidine kinase n=1 Tax=Polaromonas jejuensis TaxID=457502 RepID=A0ABW0Q679_9BURK|nr:HAMP domain-containing sensor histidine kinase [Polaromonas jejuensis]